MDPLTEIRIRLVEFRTELDAIDGLLDELQSESEVTRRHLARAALGEVWGATKLGVYLGFSRNHAHKLMQTELAGSAWTDRAGRLRVNRRDVEAWLAAKAAQGG